jgi:superkiller protein 3
MQNNLSKSIKNHFLKVLELDPKFSKAYYQLALIYKKNGNDKEAEIHLLKSIKFDLFHLDKFKKKANYFLDKFQFSNAKALLFKSQEIKNSSAYTHYVLSCLYINQKKMTKAKAYLGKSIVLNPNLAKSHRELGMIYFKENDFDLARQHLEISLDLDYGDYESHFRLGIIMRKNKDYHISEQYFLSSLDINPLFIDCLLEMANLKLLMKKKDEAKSYYEKAKKLSVNIADEELDDM